jgi:hypothetical protein
MTTQSIDTHSMNYDQLSLLKNKPLTDFMTSLLEFSERYKNFEPNVRFILLTDKIRILFKVIQGVTAISLTHENTYCSNSTKTTDEKLADITKQNCLSETFNKVFDAVQNEISDLENYIQESSKNTQLMEQFERMNMTSSDSCDKRSFRDIENAKLKPPHMSQEMWDRMVAEENAYHTKMSNRKSE